MQSTALVYSDDFLNNLNRRERKKARKLLRQNNSALHLSEIHPKTKNQALVWDEYQKGMNLLCHGVAGTGKTYLSIFLGLKEALRSNTGRNLTIVRSVVPTRDIGYLPGTASQKCKGYEQPYANICNQLFNKGDAYENLKMRNYVNFMSTSFIRGITIENSVVLVDECQNMTFHELDSIITRLGENCRIIFSGDFRQTDLKTNEEKQGLKMFMKVLNDMEEFSCVEFDQHDIVRSSLVKNYIVSKLNYGIV